jgi:predicted ATPase
MKKVLITGPYSTGKSTTVAALSRALHAAGLSVEAVDEVARRCPFPLGPGQTEDATLWLLHQQMADEVLATLHQPDVLLCDRGIPDILAHWLDVRANRPESIQMDAFISYARTWAKTYDQIFLSSIDQTIPPEPDALRIIDAAYRTRMQVRAREAMALLDVVAELLPPTLDERITFIKERLNR